MFVSKKFPQKNHKFHCLDFASYQNLPLKLKPIINVSGKIRKARDR